jgi:hypothetical protein
MFATSQKAVSSASSQNLAQSLGNCSNNKMFPVYSVAKKQCRDKEKTITHGAELGRKFQKRLAWSWQTFGLENLRKSSYNY